MRTQVAIIGAGPAGLLLAQMLHRSGIAAVVLERHDRAYVEGRVRAGLLERTTVELMRDLGLGARLDREGMLHTGVKLAHEGGTFRIELSETTGTLGMMIYGQQEVMKDLFDGAEARGLSIVFNAEDVRPLDIETDRPAVTWREGRVERRLDCELIVGCDGYHGVSRASIPAGVLSSFERVYPFGWLGILAETPPANHELIYASHERGFALATMRSPTRSRNYIQCGIDERVEDWPDERFWDEFERRLGPENAAGVRRAPSFEKSIAPLRSFVAEPMRHGRLFLAGDAAHIVPPTGAKGLNLAASDVVMLAEAFQDYFQEGSAAGIDHYSARALARVWKAERFSWWFTLLTHRFPDMGGLERRLQAAELDYLQGSPAAQAAFAENYVGLPLT